MTDIDIQENAPIKLILLKSVQNGDFFIRGGVLGMKIKTAVSGDRVYVYCVLFERDRRRCYDLDGDQIVQVVDKIKIIYEAGNA